MRHSSTITTEDGTIFAYATMGGGWFLIVKSTTQPPMLGVSLARENLTQLIEELTELLRSKPHD
jgi:hypothetical protein